MIITAEQSSKKHLDEIEEIISLAVKKVGVQKETQLCPYLPWDDNQLHHLKFLRLKRNQPEELKKMISMYIIEKSHPEIISRAPSKPRDGAKLKRISQVKLRKGQIDRLVSILQKTGDLDLISFLTPHQSLTQVKKLMIEMVRKDEVDSSLIETYSRLIQEKESAKLDM